MDQLQRLHQEFDFAYAARPELEVVGHLAPLHFHIDQRLHLAQAIERGVVEVSAVDKRPQGFQQAFAGGKVAGNGPGLDPGIAFPVAAFALVILLHRREAQGQPARGAEGSQAQVDAMAEAVGGHFAEQLRQALADAGEVALGVQRARTVAVAVLGEGIDQVDVRGKVQFTATQLAQAEND